MTYDDPLSIVFKSLWNCAEASEHVTELVRLKNRIRLDQNNDPIKRTVTDADLPELTLLTDGGNVGLQVTSSGTKITKNFAWMIATGQTLVCERILPVEFALVRAMKNWPEHVAQETWNGKRFVNVVRMNDITEGESDPERNRGIKGWSALMNIEVEMTFQTGDL